MVQEVIWAATVAVVAVVVFVIGNRVRPKSWQHTNDEAAGSMVLDLIKTIFTAIVAFVVVICWQQHDNARGRTITEANALIATYVAAHSLPDPEHRQVQGLVRNYTNHVVTMEWPLMNREHRLSSEAQSTLDTLRDAVTAIQSPDSNVTDLRSAALSNLERVAEARNDRALALAHGIPRFLYVALWFGVVLLLLSPALSGVRVTRRSVVMIALLGVVVGSALLQIHNLDHPFSSGDMVGAEAYQQALARYAQIT